LYDTRKMLRFGADQVEVWCHYRDGLVELLPLRKFSLPRNFSHLWNQFPDKDPAVGYGWHPEIKHQHKVPVFLLCFQACAPFREKTV
jgi:hypothetical protein